MLILFKIRSLLNLCGSTRTQKHTNADAKAQLRVLFRNLRENYNAQNKARIKYIFSLQVAYRRNNKVDNSYIKYDQEGKCILVEEYILKFTYVSKVK